jgi:hypothetical protein
MSASLWIGNSNGLWFPSNSKFNKVLSFLLAFVLLLLLLLIMLLLEVLFRARARARLRARCPTESNLELLIAGGFP